MCKPSKPHSFSDAQWDEYLGYFALTYESYRVGACVWLCNRETEEVTEGGWLESLAHDYLLREQDAPLPQC